MCDKQARMIQKRGSGLPTIPVSTDPRYGDWLLTDIFEGEQYQDIDTGRWYSRIGTTIVEINISLPGTLRRYITNHTQTGVLAPTTSGTLINDFSTFIRYSYTAVGDYLMTFPDTWTEAVVVGTHLVPAGGSVTYEITSTNTVRIRTYNAAGVATDGILTATGFMITFNL